MISTIVDVNALHERIALKKLAMEKARRKRPLIRLWDGDWNLYGELAGERAGSFEFIENETGTASLKIPVSHYIALWVADHRGRAKKNVHVTFDKQGARWGGRMDHYKIVRSKNDVYLEIVFKHDYEELKHIRCWANPFLPAEFQFPKTWLCFGPAKWALSVTLLVNIMRLESSIWMLPDDPMDPSQWFNFDQSTWSMVVKPFDFASDNSNVTTVFSRFKSFHDVAKRVLADAQLTMNCRRYLEGDPLPWDGADLRHGCLVFEIEDNSGWRQETSFGGNLLTGLERAFVTIASDGLTEGIDVITGDPTFPDEYYEPGWRGTRPVAPWIVFEEGPLTGIESSEFIYYPATDVQVVVGGHSAPGVNEAISASVIAIGGFIGSLFAQSQVGPAVDAIAKPLYTDVVAAFQSWKDVGRAQDLGWSHYHERMGEGADRAYTLAALVALRAGMWSSREHTAHTLKVSDAAPYFVGDNGEGDFFIGSRVGTTVLGQPDQNQIFVERVQKIKYEWDENGPKGWNISIGHREPEDPMMKSFELIQELASGLQEMGVL